MKISEFCAITEINQSTARYYVKCGLIVPETINKQYVFSQKCVEDMAIIKQFKSMGCSISLIHEIISLYRVSNFSLPEDQIKLNRKLLSHQEYLKQEIKTIQERQQRVKNIRQWNSDKDNNSIQSMKMINEFALKNKLSVRKVRYYVYSGLLAPQKEDGKLLFDNKCQYRIDLIRDLQFIGASLDEISEVLNEENHDALKFLLDKQKQVIREELREKKKQLDNLRQLMEEMPAMHGDVENTGIPINMLSYLCCPYCKSKLTFSEVLIEHDTISDGTAHCQCGYSARIQDGIFISEDIDGEPFFSAVHDGRDLYDQMVPSEISEIQKSANWIMRELNEISPAGKVIFENCINTTSLLCVGISLLKNHNSYIIADSNLEALRDVKRRIETLEGNYDILYIATDSTSYPLQDTCIDIVIDYYSSEMLQMSGIESLSLMMTPYVKPGTEIVGSFSYLDSSKKSLLNLEEWFPNAAKMFMRLKPFKEYLKNSNVVVTKELAEQYVMGSGLKFMAEGEKMEEYWYRGIYSGL